jgi:Transposase and inactivated derivatives
MAVPWEISEMDAKKEFVEFAGQPGVKMRELCRRFRISRTTGYQLLARYEVAQAEGLKGQDLANALRPHSRRPQRSPNKTDEAIEEMVLAMRDETHWGGRKIARRLQDLGLEAAPPRATVHSILKRNGRIEPRESQKREPFHRFEHPEPNDLWQMDFKGRFALRCGECHALTVLDDHSRYDLCLDAHGNETTETVQGSLTKTFQKFGLPWRMTMDNGSPWGDDGAFRLTKVTVWLIRYGVGVSHSRPYHPQTQGKDERFHETMEAELLRWKTFRDLAEAQREFDRWRDRYNLERPHEALGLDTPVKHYQPSPRCMPERIPPIEYNSSDTVRKVDTGGKIHYAGRTFRVGKGCAELPVAIRPTTEDGIQDVFFCHQWIAELNLKDPQ